MGANLDFSFAVLVGFGQVFLELDTDELPLVGSAWQFGRCSILDDFLEVGVLVGGLIALRADDGVAGVFFELESQIELLAFLRAVVGVDGRLFPLVELLQVHDMQFLQMTIFLHLTAPTTAYLLSHWRSASFEPVRSDL